MRGPERCRFRERTFPDCGPCTEAPGRVAAADQPVKLGTWNAGNTQGRLALVFGQARIRRSLFAGYQRVVTVLLVAAPITAHARLDLLQQHPKPFDSVLLNSHGVTGGGIRGLGWDSARSRYRSDLARLGVRGQPGAVATPLVHHQVCSAQHDRNGGG